MESSTKRPTSTDVRPPPMSISPPPPLFRSRSSSIVSVSSEERKPSPSESSSLPDDKNLGQRRPSLMKSRTSGDFDLRKCLATSASDHFGIETEQSPTAKALALQRQPSAGAATPASPAWRASPPVARFARASTDGVLSFPNHSRARLTGEMSGAKPQEAIPDTKPPTPPVLTALTLALKKPTELWLGPASRSALRCAVLAACFFNCIVFPAQVRWASFLSCGR